MRQYVKVYFQSTGDTEWAEKKSFFLKNNVESLGIGGTTSITFSFTDTDGKGSRPSGLRILSKGNGLRNLDSQSFWHFNNLQFGVHVWILKLYGYLFLSFCTGGTVFSGVLKAQLPPRPPVTTCLPEGRYLCGFSSLLQQQLPFQVGHLWGIPV